MRRDMNEPGKIKGEEGQALIMALLLSAVLIIMGYGLIRMHLAHMKVNAETKHKDRLFTVGDAAIHRAMTVLTKGSGTSELWDVADNIAGYKSLTDPAAAFTDIQGAKYWIKIMMGDLADTRNAWGADDDLKVANWVNVGDLNLDRTIFVRVVESFGGRQDAFYSVIHRNDVVYVPGIVGMQTTGCMDLGNSWSGDTFTSCNGPYGGTNQSGTGGSVANGSVQSPCISGGGSGFTLTKDNSPPNPPPPPASTFLAQETNVQASSPLADIIANTTIGTNWPSFWGGGAYRIDDFMTTGNKVINLDISRGYVHVYVSGTLSLGGNIDLLVISPNAKVLIDSFANTFNYNKLGLNALAFSTSGTAQNQHLAVTDTGQVFLRLTPTAAGFTWYSCMASATATANLKGYRLLNFRAKGDAGGEAFNVGMVVKLPGDSVETTTTAAVAGLSNAWKDFNIPLASILPMGLSYPAEAYVKRIIVNGLSAGSKINMDDFSISRFGGPYCCGTEDAVIYQLGANPVTLSGNGDYQGLLYCPESDVTVSGGGNGYFNGAIVAKTFSTSGGGAGWFHYDSCLARSAGEIYSSPPVVITSWRQVGKKY